MVGEISSDDPFGTIAEYTSENNKLQMAYLFNLLTREFSAKHIRQTVESLEARIGDGWPCWSFSNHDVMRVMTRWGGDQPTGRLGQGANRAAHYPCEGAFAFTKARSSG